LYFVFIWAPKEV